MFFLSSAVDFQRNVPKPVLTPSGVSSRSVSPFSRKPSPPHSATPLPTSSGLSFSKSIVDILKKINELWNQEVLKLRSQVESLRQRCEFQELELQKSLKKVQETMAVAADEAAKSKAAKEVIKSLTVQLKDMAERLPPGVYDTNNMRPAYVPNGLEPNGIHYPDANVSHHSRSNSINGYSLASPTRIDSATINGSHGPTQLRRDSLETNGTNPYQHSMGLLSSNGRDDHLDDVRLSNGNGGFK